MQNVDHWTLKQNPNAAFQNVNHAFTMRISRKSAVWNETIVHRKSWNKEKEKNLIKSKENHL